MTSKTTSTPTTTAPQETVQAPLKHYAMWANFDKLISKLNDEEVEDLNIGLVVRIGEDREQNWIKNKNKN